MSKHKWIHMLYMHTNRSHDVNSNIALFFSADAWAPTPECIPESHADQTFRSGRLLSAVTCKQYTAPHGKLHEAFTGYPWQSGKDMEMQLGMPLLEKCRAEAACEAIRVCQHASVLALHRPQQHATEIYPDCSMHHCGIRADQEGTGRHSSRRERALAEQAFRPLDAGA